MDDNNEEEMDIQTSIEEQPPIVNDIDLRDINEVFIRNGMNLKCKFVFKTDGEAVSEFKALSDLLSDKSEMNGKSLCKQILAKISRKQMGERLYHDFCNWTTREGSILAVESLPYLSLAFDMKFHGCTIDCHKNRRVFVPSKENHQISNTIYYICDKSGQYITAIFITDHAYINHIHNKLLLPIHHNVDDKVHLYDILISEYIIQAKQFQFHQHLLLLSKWQDIYKCYKARMLLERILTVDESLDYCQCLIMLSKYTVAEKWLSKLPNKKDKKDELLCLLARAQRKRKNYSDKTEKQKYESYLAAKETLDNAIVLGYNSKEIEEEQKIIGKLEKRKSSEEISRQYNIENKNRADDCLTYNILSIDGGGIRGIMAAIWLNELERKTKRTCSSMFQMMAGTSTGAIIAAGLSAPKENYPTTRARYASELVDIYKTRGEEIFVKKIRNILNYHRISYSLAPKYSSDGKQCLFKKYFGETRLYQCLTDILIPVVKSGDTYTHLYTKNDSLYSTLLVDVLMATTAAPTYFKPHCMNGTNYIDGGVQMNNPTLAAYAKAIEYGYDKKHIFVLSLGTGDYIEDSLVANDHPDILHYLRRHETVVKVLLDSQQHNVDYQMSKIMNDESYYRWQVWFEEPIELDKYEENIVNKLENIAYEYWEEMEMYDDNRLNRLIERLSHE